ncbi:MAG: gliding motility protein GldL [Bacteroidia bacterium]|nr:gliding motility protein GldL [Bacteroidia bacterium]
MFKDFRPGTRKWKNFMAKLYGLGASVVIVGALFKIMHWPFSGPLLVVGLSTEAIIFAFSAFEPIHEEVDWSLVYPELAGMHGEGHEAKEELPAEEEKLSITEQLDNMLEEAKIGPELIASLGDGMKNLSDQANKISNITEASVATGEYVSSVKSAAKNVSELSSSYSKAAESMMGLSMTAGDSANFGEQLSKVSKNLTSLNSVYELQLKGSEEHLRATNKMYESIESVMSNLSASMEDTKRYKQEMAVLAQNLESLNTVYGNMLTAMNVRK